MARNGSPDKRRIIWDGQCCRAPTVARKSDVAIRKTSARRYRRADARIHRVDNEKSICRAQASGNRDGKARVTDDRRLDRYRGRCYPAGTGSARSGHGRNAIGFGVELWPIKRRKLQPDPLVRQRPFQECCQSCFALFREI